MWGCLLVPVLSASQVGTSPPRFFSDAFGPLPSLESGVLSGAVLRGASRVARPSLSILRASGAAVPKLAAQSRGYSRGAAPKYSKLTSKAWHAGVAADKSVAAEFDPSLYYKGKGILTQTPSAEQLAARMVRAGELEARFGLATGTWWNGRLPKQLSFRQPTPDAETVLILVTGAKADAAGMFEFVVPRVPTEQQYGRELLKDSLTHSLLLYSEHYHVELRVVNSLADAASKVDSVLGAPGSKLRHVSIMGHGDPTTLWLGSNTDGLGQGNAPKSRPLIEAMRPHLRTGAVPTTVVLEGCECGRGVAGGTNLGEWLARQLPGAEVRACTKPSASPMLVAPKDNGEKFHKWPHYDGGHVVMHPNGEELVYQPAEIFYQAPAEPLHQAVPPASAHESNAGGSKLIPWTVPWSPLKGFRQYYDWNGNEE